MTDESRRALLALQQERRERLERELDSMSKRERLGVLELLAMKVALTPNQDSGK